MLTVIQASNDLLSKLGLLNGDPTQAPPQAQQDVIVALNQAGQLLQRAGETFFTRRNMSLALSAGTAIYSLPSTVQAVIGPVLLNGAIPLQALLSKGDYNQFDRIFLGQTDFGVDNGTPMAYWPEFVYNGATTGDIEGINLYIAPVPASSATIALDVVNAWVPITIDMIAGTTVLPVAKNYAETILLPIARRYILRSSQFSRPDISQQIEADADAALAFLGTAGGFPNTAQPDPAREVNA